MDARAAADAIKSRRVKSDNADAYALAEMLRTGWYRAVYVKSQDSHRLKAMLGARDQLVRAKRALGNRVRGLLRPFGIRLPSRQGTKKFAEAAHQAVRRDNMLHGSVTALLETLAAIEGQIARLDEQLKELARRSPVCWRLMSVPGVGPIVAHKPVPSDAQRRSLSGAHNQALPIQRDGRGAWHLAAGGRDGAPLSLRGGERAPDHGQEAISAKELGPQADEAARAEAGTRRGRAQARHPLRTNLER
jgi:hypothetical protein